MTTRPSTYEGYHSTSHACECRGTTGITYTHYIQQAIYEHAQVTGDTAFLKSQLQGMIESFGLWQVQFDEVTGLYHRTPLSDSQEYSLPDRLLRMWLRFLARLRWLRSGAPAQQLCKSECKTCCGIPIFNNE